MCFFSCDLKAKPCSILHSTTDDSVKNVEKWQLIKSCGLPFHGKRPCEASCVCFARSLFFVVCMDTAVFLSTVYSASLSLNFSRTNMSILPSRFGPFHLLGFVLSGLLASIPIPHKLSNGLASTSSLFPVCRRV